MPTESYDTVEDAVEGFKSDMLRPRNRRLTIYRNKVDPFIKITKRYTMIFDDNFDTIINEYPLTITDVKILSYLKKHMEFGNLIKLRQTDIAKHFDINRANVSKSIKRLEEARVVMRIGSDMYINPHFGLKADPYVEDEKLERLINIANELIKGTNIKPAVVYNEFVDEGI